MTPPPTPQLLRSRAAVASAAAVIGIAALVAPAATGSAAAARETKVEKTEAKAERLAAAIAKGIDGSPRAAIRRGIAVKTELKTGEASIRLQVRRGDRWVIVAVVRAPRGETERTLRPGPVGRSRLAAAPVRRGRIEARLAVSLEAGRTRAAAAERFSLSR